MSPNVKGGFGLSDLDFDSLADLHEICFEDCWDKAALQSLCSAKTCLTLIYFNEVQVINGFIMIQHSGLEADILTICVDPAKRRCGIAKSLLNASFQLLKNLGTDAIFLEVLENNEGAYRTYIKFGFELVGTRNKYYNNQFSAYTMKKELDLV